MSWRRQWAKFAGLLRRNKQADDVAEEIRFHLWQEEQENLNAGMPQQEARQAAARRFGNITAAHERSGDMWRWDSLETPLQDLRFGIRQLRQNPAFTSVALVTIALGIGATTAMFSLVNAVLLRPLPFKDPERLVRLFETEVSPGQFPLTGADYLDWQSQNKTFEASSLFSWWQTANASGASEPELAAVASAQANFFDVLGVRPLAGRTFLSGEDTAGKNRVAVLSYGFWQRHFGGTTSLGRTVTLDNEVYTVVGVMPAGFHFVGTPDLWVPLDMNPQKLGQRGTHSWAAIARLKSGVTLPQARADLLAISKRLEKDFPDSNNHVHALLIPLKDTLVGDSKTPLLILLGAVTLLLSVACVNVANLQLARASTRQREMAVRASLGAGRLRLIRQILTESVLLSLLGAAVGVAGAWWFLRLIDSIKSIPLPRANPLALDGAVLLFATTVSIVVGVLFGLAPALQTSELALNKDLKAGALAVLGASDARRILRNGLVVAEIALTLALLVGAGLLLRSFAFLRNAPIGIDPHNLLTASVALPETKYATYPAREHFFNELLERARNTPGVVSATISTEIPLEGGNNGTLTVEGKKDSALESQLVGFNYVTPEYFRTLGIPILQGRIFDQREANSAGEAGEKLDKLYKAAMTAGQMQVHVPDDVTYVAVVSQSAARTFWRNENPIGKAFRHGDVRVTVVGVVGDVKEYGVRAAGMPQAYFPLPLALAWYSQCNLAIKTRIAPSALLSAVRQHLHALDGGLALFRPRPMDEVIAEDSQDVSIQAFLLGAFALLALVLAAIGLFGVMSYVVTQRTREIGIRMALGAQQTNVLRLIMRQGAVLTAIGIGLGAMATLGLTRSLSSVLYGVTANDPLTFAAVAGLMALVALVAYYVPARRATKVDPMLALRCE